VSKQGVAARVSARPIEPESAPAVPQVIAHAYALVQDPSGGWHALHLEGVSAQKITRLEPNTRPEPPTFAVSRVSLAIERQFRQDMRDSAARGRARAREAAVKP
jgi:hypothetical protein